MNKPIFKSSNAQGVTGGGSCTFELIVALACLELSKARKFGDGIFWGLIFGPGIFWGFGESPKDFLGF